jgi:L-histidine N-alpha-methyltransferase
MFEMLKKTSPQLAEARRAAETRLSWLHLGNAGEDEVDCADLARGLAAAPKELPCRFFYDDRGSELFELITALPEYYPTRTERALLADCAPAIARLVGRATLVELGAGSAEKTRLLLDAFGARGGAPGDAPLGYVAIDVSAASLRGAAERLLADYPHLAFGAVVGRYEEGLAALADAPELPRLVLFLGSTIGNLAPAEMSDFLAGLRAHARPGDYFLVGTDLVKDPAIIEAAYNDAQGVTAAFNLNILRHLNRRFDGDFALERFAHRAVYDRIQRQIEMQLESLAPQRVALAALGLEAQFRKGEIMRTEISRKFELDELRAELARHRFAPLARWRDPKGWFGLTLARAE